MQSWQMQTAKARFSEVVKHAADEGPQEITVHGRPVAVIISPELFDRLSGNQNSLVDFMRQSPLYGRDDITFDKRFYAGGGGSVRGYTYQSIGPRDAANRPLGGSSLVEGSIEWRQRLSENWGMAAFLDAGAVGEEARPDVRQMRAGTGLGLRYLTAIGPLRFDLGLPLDRQKDDPSFAIYIGFGQAF